MNYMLNYIHKQVQNTNTTLLFTSYHCFTSSCWFSMLCRLNRHYLVLPRVSSKPPPDIPSIHPSILSEMTRIPPCFITHLTHQSAGDTRRSTNRPGILFTKNSRKEKSISNCLLFPHSSGKKKGEQLKYKKGKKINKSKA